MNLKRGVSISTVAFSLILVAILAPISVFYDVSAISEQELYFYSQNGIYFYNPEGETCKSTLMGSFDGDTSAGLSDLQAAFVDTYHEIAENLSVAYGIPWEAVMAQGILESVAGTSSFAVNRNNFFGIGAFDSNPDNAFSYDTPEAGWRGYYENIRKTATYREHGVFSGETVTNPYAYAEAIKAAGYATDPNYVAKLNTLIAAVENRAKERGWKSSAELAALNSEMKINAAAFSEGEGGGGVYTAYSTCVFAAAGNGDINSTAIALSWDNRDHAPTDPKIEYRNALESTGVSLLGDVCSMGGYSCDAFLATVMRYSDVDSEFPCCGAAMQLDYLASSPLYEEIPNLGNTSNLRPGDIRASGSHVEIVVQLNDGTYKIASASHCDRTADHYDDYYAGENFRVFRRK
ncbi:glucosaminidase domain-containing protein [Candidatus Saccharibacteria bacterium]|nr:glucosaminidase domain-containing protein [Candidatus Saccharibacteria bacterium]